jgi:hypothetical protein
MKKIQLHLFTILGLTIQCFSTSDVLGQACLGNQVNVTFCDVAHDDSTIIIKVCVENTGTTALKMSALAGGFTYDPALIPSGATLTANLDTQPLALDFPTLIAITTTPVLMNNLPNHQIRWQETPTFEANAVTLTPGVTYNFCKIKLSLGSTGVWDANFPFNPIWNTGLGTAFQRVTTTVYCEGNTNSTSLYEINPGTAVLSNLATPVVLNPANPLPVQYKNFTAKKVDASNIISWITSNEVSCGYFNLQRSVDGKQFQTIAKVNSKASNGQSSTDLSYQYEDVKPRLGHNYYRLAQVDLDAKTNLSKVIDVLRSEITTQVHIYPNPVLNQLFIDITSEKSAIAEVHITDVTGRMIKTIKANLIAGTNPLEIGMSDIAAGNYDVSVFQNSKLMTTQKIAKQ